MGGCFGHRRTAAAPPHIHAKNTVPARDQAVTHADHVAAQMRSGQSMDQQHHHSAGTPIDGTVFMQDKLVPLFVGKSRTRRHVVSSRPVGRRVARQVDSHHGLQVTAAKQRMRAKLEMFNTRLHRDSKHLGLRTLVGGQRPTCPAVNFPRHQTPRPRLRLP
jgi:ABC-type Zn2+ transport system substrate-binding protein/surface adhesin